MRIIHIVTAMSLPIILAVTLVLPPLLVAAPQNSTVVHDQVRNKMFTDVSVAHPNFDAIYFGYNTGFVEGYGAAGQRARQYKPDQLINRAEFLKVVMEGTGQTNVASARSCFPDVPANAWFAPYVCQAKLKGWIGGYPDGRFRPEQTINEAEALKILLQIQALQVSTPAPGEPWYAGYREVGDERNIIPTEDMASQMDRGDVMEMVYRNTMVDDLNIQKFNAQYKDELMDEHDIAYDGVLGPGGAFGPGGVGGNAGAGIAFADETVTPEQAREEGLVSPVEAAYFALHPCYYSDAGDFSDLVIPSLARMTGGDVSALKLAGYDMTGFGTLFCHDREIETDLKRLDLDEAARDGFELTCWRDPVYSSSKDGSSEQIFCYVQDHAPKRDSYCEAVPDDRGRICEVCYNDVIERTETSRSCGPGSTSIPSSATLSSARLNVPSSDVTARKVIMGDKRVQPTATDVPLLTFQLTVENDTQVTSIEVRSIGEGSPYGIRTLSVREVGHPDVITRTSLLTIADWKKGIVFELPVRLVAGHSIALEVRGDFGWDHDDGTLQLGIPANGILTDEGPVAVATALEGARVSRTLLEDTSPSGELCALWDPASGKPYSKSQGPPAVGQAAPLPSPPPHDVNPYAHLVKPIDQGRNNTCMASATYASLRWFEHELAGVDVVRDGLPGLLSLSGALHGPAIQTANDQLVALVKWLQDSRPGCFSTTFNTLSPPPAVSCAELAAQSANGCDIPLQFSCKAKTGTGTISHAVDLVAVGVHQLDNKCNIEWANSWVGTSPPQDGLGGGRYETARYDPDTGELTVETPWGAKYNCTLWSAAFICIDDITKCR